MQYHFLRKDCFSSRCEPSSVFAFSAEISVNNASGFARSLDKTLSRAGLELRIHSDGQRAANHLNIKNTLIYSWVDERCGTNKSNLFLVKRYSFQSGVYVTICRLCVPSCHASVLKLSLKRHFKNGTKVSNQFGSWCMDKWNNCKLILVRFCLVNDFELLFP